MLSWLWPVSLNFCSKSFLNLLFYRMFSLSLCLMIIGNCLEVKIVQTLASYFHFVTDISAVHFYIWAIDLHGTSKLWWLLNSSEYFNAFLSSAQFQSNFYALMLYFYSCGYCLKTLSVSAFIREWCLCSIGLKFCHEWLAVQKHWAATLLVPVSLRSVV